MPTTYRRNPAPTYGRNFRRQWFQALPTAVAKAKAKKGWTMIPQTMMGKQVEAKAEALRRRGYEVERIPITQWQSQPIEFLLYKPTARVEAVKAQEAAAQRAERRRDDLAAAYAAALRAWMHDIRYKRSISYRAQVSIRLKMEKAEEMLRGLRTGQKTTEEAAEFFNTTVRDALKEGGVVKLWQQYYKEEKAKPPGKRWAGLA